MSSEWKKHGWFWVEMEICWFLLRFFKRFCFMDWCQLDMQIWYRSAFAENESGSTVTCRSCDFWICLCGWYDTWRFAHVSLQSSRNSPTIATKLVMSPRPSFHLHDSCHPFFFTKQEASRENSNARCVSMVLETCWHEWICSAHVALAIDILPFKGKDCAFLQRRDDVSIAMWDSLPIYRSFWVF